MDVIENPVEDCQLLRQLCEQIGQESEFSVDTEFTRIRTYRPRLELVQLAARDLAFCVDVPLCRDISPLLTLLRSSSVTIVMHSASQDLEIFRDCDAVPTRIIDTQLAARLCGYERVSYKDVVCETIGMQLCKSMTRSDWSRRPLSRRQIQYALDDVRYLPDVWACLSNQLDAMGRMSWLAEECGRLLGEYRREISDLDIYRSFQQAAELNVADQCTVRELLLWREYRARRLDLPKQWIVSDANIMKVVKFRPDNEERLSQLIGFRKRRTAGWLREMLKILKSPADHTTAPIWTVQESLDSAQKKLHRKIMEIARELANEHRLPVDLICTSKEVGAIVRGDREGRPFTGWRKRIFASVIAELLE